MKRSLLTLLGAAIFGFSSHSQTIPTMLIKDSLTVATDSSWDESTVVTSATATTYPTWPGVDGNLPDSATYSVSAQTGQPYSFPSIDSVNGADVIVSDSNVHYFRQYFWLPSDTNIQARFRFSVDDNAEIYINGKFLARNNEINSGNFNNPPFDVFFKNDGTVVNPNAGGDSVEIAPPVDLDTVMQEGRNELVVVLRNRHLGDKGGFSLRMDLSCITREVPVAMADSIVSDSSWTQSTTITTQGANKYPWPGVDGNLPDFYTFTDSAMVGQPYPWHHVHEVPGSQAIKAMSGIYYFKKTFSVVDSTDVNARFRAYFDDNIEVYLNGVALFREEDIKAKRQNYRGDWHDILFKDDGTFDNGFMGNKAFSHPSAVDLDTVLRLDSNELVVVLRNRTKKNDKGGFSFRLDMDKGGQSVIIKRAEVDRISAEETIALDFEMYPNPTTGELYLELTEENFGRQATVMIYDLSGRMLLQDQIDAATETLNLDLSAVNQGVYLVRLVSGNQSATQRLIKH